MNRYPLWKYLIIGVALLFGAIYTAPNFFGEAPAVQVSSQRPTVKVDAGLLTRIESSLKSAGVAYEAAYVETVSDGGKVRWGIGVDPNITTASLRAVLCAFERHQR